MSDEIEELRAALRTLVAKGCFDEGGWDGEYWICRFCDADGQRNGVVVHAPSCPWPAIVALSGVASEQEQE